MATTLLALVKHIYKDSSLGYASGDPTAGTTSVIVLTVIELTRLLGLLFAVPRSYCMAIRAHYLTLGNLSHDTCNTGQCSHTSEAGTLGCMRHMVELQRYWMPTIAAVGTTLFQFDGINQCAIAFIVRRSFHLVSGTTVLKFFVSIPNATSHYSRITQLSTRGEFATSVVSAIAMLVGIVTRSPSAYWRDLQAAAASTVFCGKLGLHSLNLHSGLGKAIPRGVPPPPWFLAALHYSTTVRGGVV